LRPAAASRRCGKHVQAAAAAPARRIKRGKKDDTRPGLALLHFSTMPDHLPERPASTVPEAMRHGR